MYGKFLRIKKPNKMTIIKLLPLVALLVLMGIQIITGTTTPDSPPPPGFT
ncbi:MAG: hypothetical protein ACTSR2_06010 [Candidatus Hodarchaeales archaeon]